MRPTQKLSLIDAIGRELQNRYTYTEIDAFLAEFGVSPPSTFSGNSKWLYSKAALMGVQTSILLQVAEELELGASNGERQSNLPPRNWNNTAQFRLFISHISKDKLIATRLKECLADHSIDGFVAHEDIHPTLEWQSEIERALATMDGLIAVHTEGFAKSVWTQQEVGFALGRGTKIISFKMGEDPTGFISKHQALPRRGRPAEAVAREIAELLASDPQTSERLKQAQAKTKQFADGAFSEDIPF